MFVHNSQRHISLDHLTDYSMLPCPTTLDSDVDEVIYDPASHCMSPTPSENVEVQEIHVCTNEVNDDPMTLLCMYTCTFTYTYIYMCMYTKA